MSITFQDFLNSKAGARYNNSMYLKSDGTPRANKGFLYEKHKMFQDLMNQSKDLPSTVVGGQVIGKARPTGIGRLWAGFQDWATGYGDRDQLGDFGYKENPITGFGKIAEGYEEGPGGKPTIKEGYETKDELDIGGQTQKEGTREEEALKKEIAKETRKEEMGTRLANQNLFRAQLAAIPDIMLRGGEGVAKIYGDQAANTLQWAANLPKYNLPAMNYTALRDYGLG